MNVPPFLRNEQCPASNEIYQRARSVGFELPSVKSLTNSESRTAFISHLKKGGKEFCRKIGLPFVDTDGAHDVTNGQAPFGDFFFADMLASLGVTQGSVLDFGCSTGRVIRNLKSAYPVIHAYGCDPRQRSIELAARFVPEITWFVSNEAPPLPTLAVFDSIFAISVWSHFSEQRALEWFAEMRRHIAIDGRLIFTTHGRRSVYHFQHVKRSMPDDRALERLEAINSGSHHYRRYPSSELDTHWGMAFMTESWVARVPDWRIENVFPGLAMANQDVHVLTPT